MGAGLPGTLLGYRGANATRRTMRVTRGSPVPVPTYHVANTARELPGEHPSPQPTSGARSQPGGRAAKTSG